MAIEIREVTRLAVKIDGRIKDVEINLDMSETHFLALFFLYGNPAVTKVQRIRHLREHLKIGLREAIALVEEAEARYEYDYRGMRDTHQDEIDDFRRNHGQDD